ncbi:MAG: glycoside hydrolase family 20 [Bacteroidetes bacterium]|nr:MAG: glycoside hydrolase family 20 [Bacteroidota bacterium]
MKKLKNLLPYGWLILLLSFQSPIEKPGVFKLLPSPQKFEINGSSLLKYHNILYCFSENSELPILGGILKNIQGVDNQKSAQIIFNINDALNVPAEGYTINISNKQITITGKDKAGLFYAFKTLEQLMVDAKEQDVYMPVSTIKDFPLLSYRSIHLDIKHHIEKTEYYYKLLDKLAGYKINAIIVEMEDKIKYERQPEIGSGDALSIAEWKKLSNYARERNIEISPLIQGLGHASFILKHEKYKDLRDDSKSDWAFNPLDPKTYEVQFDLYLDAIDATPHGKYLHIGGDEVHTTGRGSNKSALELQMLWLNKVCKFAEEHNRIPIFWDDMPLKHAGVYKAMFNTQLTQQEVDKIWKNNEHKLLKFLDQFPKNCIYMRWNYSSSQAIGNAKAMEWFRNHGMEVMGATAGQTRWVLMPQEESNMNNIRAFALSSIDNGLNGLLLTLWDDDSPHFELYMRGIIAFSEYSWSGEKGDKEDLKSAYRHREFSNTLAGTEFSFIDQLEQPVAFWKNALLKGNKRNYIHKQKNAIDKSVIDLPVKNKKGKWTKHYAERLAQSTEILKRCDSISVKISAMKAQANRNIYTLEVYEQVNKLVRFTTKALLTIKAYDVAKNKEQEIEALRKVKQLPKEFEILRKEFEKVYSKTRILTKPDNYILDQDHHVHLANQTISFDWQFYAELLFLEKIVKEM